MKILLLLFGLFQFPTEIFIVKDGFVEVEAECYHIQKNAEERTWQIKNKFSEYDHHTDPDSMEYLTASGECFVELLPDTRVTSKDKLLQGINFSREPCLSILEYNVKFQTPGKYYVWVRAFSTGSEDNSIHVGIDDTWPESGKQMQWCEGKNKWTWESKQRTKSNHCGEPMKIFLIVEEPGTHKIQFAMREDGFAFDKFVLTTKYEKPIN